MPAQHYSKLKADIRAAWRRKAREEMERRGAPLPANFRERVEGDGDLSPPDAQRVARRAAVMSAVALRGLASTWAHAEQADFLPQLQGWFGASGLADEAEPPEVEAIAAPASELDQRSALNATWRWEGTAVLVAALGRLPLPGFQQVVEPKPCGDAAGLLAPPDALRELIDTAAFAPAFDRFAFADQMLAIHWRLRQWRVKPGGTTDLAAYARSIDWATFNLDGVQLVNGDLAIGGATIAVADPNAISTTSSIVSERHHAANWLIGWDAAYGNVETPT